MNNALTEVKPYVYTSPQGLKLEVLFVLDPEKKGYINATAIAKQFDKKPHDWLKYQPVQEYINALIERINTQDDYNLLGTKSIGYDDLVITIHGGALGQHGTWLHPKLAVFFARWLSPHFAVWCDELIAKLLNPYPTQQRQFPELSAIFNKLNKLDQQFSVIEQRFEENINTTAQMLNHWQAKSTQDHKHTLGQIFNGINQINRVLGRQQNADLLKPPVESVIQQTLVDYQHNLEQMLWLVRYKMIKYNPQKAHQLYNAVFYE